MQDIRHGGEGVERRPCSAMGNPAAGALVTYLSPVVLVVVARSYLAHPQEASCVSCCCCLLPSRSWRSERPHPHRPRRARSIPGRPGDRPGRDRAHVLHHRDRLRVVEQAAVVQGRRRPPSPGTKLFDFAGSTGLINGVPTTAGSFTFTVRVKDETRATDTETFTIEILRRGADDHHRGAFWRNGRRVLLLWQPVRQRWGPALQLVGGRRGAACWPGAAEGEHHLWNAHHGRHVQLHRPGHRRSGRLQREELSITIS